MARGGWALSTPTRKIRALGTLLAAVAAVWMVAAAVRAGSAELSTSAARTVADAGGPGPAGSTPAPFGPGALPAPVWNPDTIDEAAGTLPRLHSLLVSHGGELIFERYYNGTRRDRPANIKSASKSLISALVGIAIDRRLIPGVETPIVTYFPELAQDPDPRKRTITIEHLLTMRSGLEGTSNRNYGAWVTSRNWVRHALARPMFTAPGEEMQYSTGNTHLLSAILTKATRRSTWQFATEALAKPLGFTLAQWPRDPQGIYFGGNDMLMTPRQMLAFGELYLNRGHFREQQIVPAAWVEQSCEGRARSRRFGNPAFDFFRGFDPLGDRKYGYGWWVHEIRGYETCFAWGYGGQYIFVVPELDLVMVTTSAPDVSEERRGHRRLLFDVLDELIVAPLVFTN
jgi:CubicO group peptidase (beta-lactamase class C family)